MADHESDGGTVDDLLRDAALTKQAASARMITDWISLGLLNHPQRRGAGRGHGSVKAYFNAHQRQLFALLLHHRANGSRVSVLTSIPVAIWTYWGDEYVPLRQARRAIDTWLKAYRQPPKRRAESAATTIVDQFASQQATETSRKRLHRLLTNAIYKGQVNDPDALVNAVRHVFDPNSQGRQLGPPMARLEPETLVRAALRRQMGIQALLSDRVPDEQFVEAQERLRQDLAVYLERQPQLAAQAGELEAIFRVPALQDVVNDVIGNLLLLLGYQLDASTESRDQEVAQKE